MQRRHARRGLRDLQRFRSTDHHAGGRVGEGVGRARRAQAPLVVRDEEPGPDEMTVCFPLQVQPRDQVTALAVRQGALRAQHGADAGPLTDAADRIDGVARREALAFAAGHVQRIAQQQSTTAAVGQAVVSIDRPGTLGLGGHDRQGGGLQVVVERDDIAAIAATGAQRARFPQELEPSRRVLGAVAGLPHPFDQLDPSGLRQHAHGVRQELAVDLHPHRQRHIEEVVLELPGQAPALGGQRQLLKVRGRRRTFPGQGHGYRERPDQSFGLLHDKAGKKRAPERPRAIR